MDALIIAAGFGSRLRDISPSKPLTPIAGPPLIELAVRQAASAGARRVVVVTGYMGAQVGGFLAELAERTGIAIVAEPVPDWTTPNGHSVVAGAARIDGDYLLTMADHLFSPAILARLAGQGRADRGVTLAIDRRTASPNVNPTDATWVETDREGRIVAIGKHILRYDAVDCGAFLATPELAEAIGEAIAAGEPGSLSDGMQRLAEAGRAATMDIGDAWWIDVDDPASFRAAEAQAPVQMHQLYGACN